MATKKAEAKKSAPRKKQADNSPISVEAVTHDDKRVNIPTADLAARLSESTDTSPLLYPRDISLDPQLVWKGKDLQDLSELSVPVVPIYIQEKIDPRVIVEHLRDTAQADQPEPELTLFDEFDGLEGTQMLEFYVHEGNWANRMILGDSLLVMSSLAEKETLRGKVQMVFIDPPYGIKFGSNWQVSTRKPEVTDGNVKDVTRQPEQVKAFRDTWELGIHSYLTYLRDRLVVSRDLLTETGSVFLQIGDENVHLVRSLLDEVFGPENFIAQIAFVKTASATSNYLASTFDHIVWFAKNKKLAKYRQLFREAENRVGYNYVQLPDGTRRGITAEERRGEVSLPEGSRIYKPDNLTSASGGDSTRFAVDIDGHSYFPGSGGWKTNREGMEKLIAARRLHITENGIYYVRFTDDFPFTAMSNFWTDTSTGGYAEEKTYVVQTGKKVIERCIQMVTDPGDLILDPTCGSGTSAVVAEQWGRRWITIDTSRVALALARTRLMSSQFPYYILADSKEGIEIEDRKAGQGSSARLVTNNIKQGFVCKKASHITLKSITNNADINPSMSYGEVEKIIYRVVESEMLVDQPFVDKSKVRVTGRFTVESLSPHRSLSFQEANSSADFAERILDHLKRAGVQNTYKGERLQFERLEAYPGEWINGEGEYTDVEGKPKRVAVVVGPEHGTVSPDLVREAAIEATDGRGFDVLIVCGLAFDPLVGEQAKKFGRLVVLPTKINPDLTMPDGLLKNTGSGNLFTVFGEPDIDIHRLSDGKVTVEVNGVDVYDPTTGVVRSGSVKDIACWFIDSNYDQKSFFVRHAYFTGGNEPYASLAKTLRTEINMEAWSALYSNKSQPFDVPTTGRIAVKVINHFGDEVMQIYDVK